jgi:hypothetical protein
MVYIDINRHCWSPKDPVTDEIIEISRANSPLVTELCGPKFTRRDPAVYRLAGDLAENGDIFDPRSPLRPMALSPPLRNALPSSEGSATFGHSRMLSYIMCACQFSEEGPSKNLTTSKLRNTAHAAVLVRFQ